jgi:hypothetical protein
LEVLSRIYDRVIMRDLDRRIAHALGDTFLYSEIERDFEIIK